MPLRAMRHIRLLVVLVSVALAAGLAESRPDSLYNRAIAAGSQNHVREAKELFCELAEKYPSYKDAKQECSMWTHELDALIIRSNQHFKDGETKLSAGDCEGAIAELGRVLEGENAKEARTLLGERVPACYFDRGLKAFHEGDYDVADLLFRKVSSGAHVEEAHAYLTENIPGARRGDVFFDEGRQAFQQEKMEEAQQKFAAVRGGKYAEEAKAYLNERIPQWYFGRGMQAFKEEQYSQAEAAFRHVCCEPYLKEASDYLKERIPAARKTSEGARQFKEAEDAYASNRFDDAKHLFEAIAADHVGEDASKAEEYVANIRRYQLGMECGRNNAGKDCRKARECYSEAWAIKPDGPGDPERKRNSLDCQAPAGAAPDIEHLLTQGIDEFRSKQYSSAEVHLQDYLSAKGARTPQKSARCHFYLGASIASRYYQNSKDSRLFAEAQAQFCLARKTPGFSIPERERSFISPRIIGAFESSCK